MNRIILGLAVAIGIAALSFSTALVNKTVDVSQSNVVWKAYKVTGAHEGTIKLKSGSLQLQDGKLTGGSFVVNMNTITCTDLTGGTADKLVGHLKSPDFFDVAKFGEATFNISGVKYTTAEKATLTGSVTIKGITKNISFEAIIRSADEKGFFAEAFFPIDRTLFGINYGVGAIDTQVQLAVHIYATK